MLDYDIYLRDIVSTVEKIENSVKEKSFEDFISDSNLFDATLMRIHFIGETIKSIPFSLKKVHKDVKWKKFEKLRNIIGHKYSSVNKNIIWDVVNNLSKLKLQIEEILNNQNGMD